MTDARREAVVRIVRENAPFETDRTADALLAWHDAETDLKVDEAYGLGFNDGRDSVAAETRALREALARTIIRTTKEGLVFHQGPPNHLVGDHSAAGCWVCALLTPTPGAGKRGEGGDT
ncbi:MAG TPA: hypothetical protein VL563_15870 [Gemmatimonadales bacterium]|jgi:hypothetical protein|nr:hypothetical protein [Gemmatimonadales bacterium]